MKTFMTITFTTLMLLLGSTLAGCGDNKTEQAKEELQQAKERAAEAAKDAGNAIEDKCEEMKEKLGAEDSRC